MIGDDFIYRLTVYYFYDDGSKSLDKLLSRQFSNYKSAIRWAKKIIDVLCFDNNNIVIDVYNVITKRNETIYDSRISGCELKWGWY